MIQRIRDMFTHTEEISAIRAEEYTRGCNDATSRFTKRVSELTETIDRLTRENLKAQQRREDEVLQHESSLRHMYEGQISSLQQRQQVHCKECRRLIDDELKWLRDMQSQLAERIRQLNDIYNWLHQHASLISDEHDSILKSSGRVKASKDVIDTIKADIDQIARDSERLLNVVSERKKKELPDDGKREKEVHRGDKQKAVNIDEARTKRAR